MRSKLFVPGSRPELVAKALAGPADAISIDLEDAVDESRKAEARESVAGLLCDPALDTRGKTIIVRVNGLSTPHFEADVAAVVGPRLDLINLAKIESAAEVREAVAALARAEAGSGLARPTRLLVNIETPRAVRNAAEIACADPRVAGLQLGLADLFEPLGIDRTHAGVVEAMQIAVRLAAGEAGIFACDAAYADVADEQGYRAEAERARRLGFIGKSCIHPRQVPLANAAFRPSEAEIRHAERIVAAMREATEKGIGAIMVDGRMIDAPFVRRAEAILAMRRDAD